MCRISEIEYVTGLELKFNIWDTWNSLYGLRIVSDTIEAVISDLKGETRRTDLMLYFTTRGVVLEASWPSSSPISPPPKKKKINTGVCAEPFDWDLDSFVPLKFLTPAISTAPSFLYPVPLSFWPLPYRPPLRLPGLSEISDPCHTCFPLICKSLASLKTLV